MDNDLYQMEEYPPGHCLAVQGLVAAKMVGFLRKLAHDFLCLIYFYNIQELREQKAKLRLARKKLRKDARSAKQSRREIKEDVEKWLADTMKSLKDWRSLEEQIQANQTSLISRLNWSQRCRLSSEIECLKQDMLHYIRTIDFDGAVLAMRLESDFATDFKPSQSLKSALFEVVNAMNVASTDSGVIVVCGPRGVGKTSLAIQLEKKAKDILNFQVLRLVVSQSTTTEQVQDKFAAFLGLNLQNKRAEERAQLLRRELETKRGILIILDNVCSCRELNLESIGISNRMSCKVVVTASDDRELRTCSITTSKVIRLGHLDKAEAWELLEKNLSPGTSSDIKEVGKRIAEEFEHSTVSIVTLGRGLRGKDYDDWMKAYKRLESKPKKGEKKGIKIVYRCVKLSYDYLTELKKHCFLLCSIFPDDYAIALEDLKRYSWGLGIYQGIDSIETVAKKVDGAIKTLTKSFLLLQHGKAHVRMTNMVRDAALLIASKDKFLRIKSRVGSWEGRKGENLDSYTAISYVASQQEELRDMEFPTEKLRILFLDGYGYKIHDEFLHRLTALKVVAIHHGVLSIIALRDLMSLKALHLEHCKLDVLSSLGELKKLEILSFRGSDISELPDQIGELKYLILLDLSDCQKLQRIPLNLIRRLSRLEELYFSGRSFEEWWSNERRMRINSLPSLATESFENQGSGNGSKALKVSALFGNESSVTLLARDSILVADNNVVPNLVQKVENMKVQNCDKCLEDICRLSDLVGIRSGQILENLTTLELKDCSKLKSLFSVTLAQSLSKLETLEIHGCKGLEQIIAETTVDVDVSVEFIAEATEEVDDGVDVRAETTDEVDIGVDEATGRVDANVILGGNESIHRRYLPSLNTLLITDCNRLKSIFQVPKGQVFPKLTRLEISNCFRLEAVFSTKEVEEQNICEVPLLERLKLEGLMSLRKFSPDNLSIKLPKLQQLEVGGCRSLSKDAMFELIGNRRLKEFRLFKMRNELCESIFDYEGGCLLACLEVLKLHDLNELQCIWKVSAQMVTLQKLEHLEVVRCNKLKNLFSLLLARNLLSLRKLIVRECDELEKLIGLDQITSSPPPPSSSSSSGYKPVYFPNLEELSLEGCNELKSLFPARVACLPSLKKFSVRRALALVDVFGNGEGDARAKRKKEGEGDRARAKTKKIEFRKLETFLLEELPNLVNFNPVDYYCEFTIKKSFQVKACNSTIVTKFEMRDSAPKRTVYTKTNDPRMLRPFPVVDMPTHNGDIDWSPGMKVN